MTSTTSVREKPTSTRLVMPPIRYNDANKEGYPRLLGGGAQNRASCAIVVLTLTVKCVVLSCLEVFFLPKMIKSRSEKFNLMLFFFFLQGMNNK